MNRLKSAGRTILDRRKGDREKDRAADAAGVGRGGSRIKVFMAPTFHRFNKYCPALVQNLSRQGLDVGFAADWTRLLPLGAMFRASGLPHVLHLHWIETYTIKKNQWRSAVASALFLAELLALKTLGVRIVWTVHDGINADGRFPAFDAAVRRFTVKLAHAAIVHSEAALAEAARVYRLADREKKKLRVIPHGHMIDTYPNRLQCAEARARLGLEGAAFVYGFIGYVRPYKGVEELIRAFRRIESPDARLVVAGMPFDDDFAGAVRTAAGDDRRIHLYLKFIPDEELQLFMNAVDVVVLPHNRALTSGSLILAMSFGKAVIAADQPAIRGTLPSGGGIVYPADDPEELIRAMREIGSRDIVAMGTRNFERARRHDWRSIAKLTADLYRKVVGTGGL